MKSIGDTMTSEEIQEWVYGWAMEAGFDAPYGVLTGSHVSGTGRPYRSVTFGRPRTLDATVEIYSRNFLVLRTNRAREVYRTVADLQRALLAI